MTVLPLRVQSWRFCAKSGGRHWSYVPRWALLGPAQNRPGTVQPLIPGHALLPPRGAGLLQRSEQVLGGVHSGWAHAADREIKWLVPVACFIAAALEEGMLGADGRRIRWPGVQFCAGIQVRHCAVPARRAPHWRLVR